MKVSVVNSAGGSFCWDYATDPLSGNYADGNVCCIYAAFDMVLSVIGMLVDLFIANVANESDCFCCSYAVRSFLSTYAGDSFCSKYKVDNFYCNYPDESLCCKYAEGIF